MNEFSIPEFWDEFPWLRSLKELDLRNCSLTTIEPHLFEQLLGLEKLFLSHNKLVEIYGSAFEHLRNLKHLDLSYQEIMKPFGYGYGNLDPFLPLFTGLYLEEDVFTGLTSLLFLDLSHTKLKPESVRALQLRNKVEQLSLCYTDLPMIAPEMFLNTNLKVLDLSGNPSLASNMNWTWFSGLENTLEILVFQNSNIKRLSPFNNLQKLRMLNLGECRGNLIVLITAAFFELRQKITTSTRFRDQTFTISPTLKFLIWIVITSATGTKEYLKKIFD